MNANPTTAAVPTHDEIVAQAIRLMAETQGREVGEVEAELQERGQEMPIDSLEAVEIMLGLEEEHGIRFQDDDATCAAFQTVQGLVEHVQTLYTQTHELGGT